MTKLSGTQKLQYPKENKKEVKNMANDKVLGMIWEQLFLYVHHGSRKADCNPEC